MAFHNTGPVSSSALWAKQHGQGAQEERQETVKHKQLESSFDRHPLSQSNCASE